MKIDTERLANDYDYWCSVAPEWATHFDTTDPNLMDRIDTAWEMLVDDQLYFRTRFGDFTESAEIEDIKSGSRIVKPKPESKTDEKLRDEIAMVILKEMLGSVKYESMDQMAQKCYKVADAMLKARKG